MLDFIRAKVHNTLRRSEKYAKTDMVEFATNNSWLFVGRVVAVGGGSILTIAFANLITPTAFGTYKYMLAMAALIGAFSLSGLGGAAMRAVAQGNKNITPRLFWISFLFSIPGSIVAAVIATYYFYMGNAVLGAGMFFISIANLSSGFILHKSLLLGSNAYQASGIYGIPRSLIPIALLIGTLLITDNLIAIFAVYFGGSFAFNYFMYRFALRHTGVDPLQGKSVEGDSAVKETTWYAFHLSMMGSASVIASQVDQLLLWHFVGPAELALYALAFAPIREIKVLLENFSPMIFTRFAMRTNAELRTRIPLRTRQMFIVSVAFAAMYAICAPLIFHIFFPQYVSAIVMSQVLAVILLVHPKSIMDSALSAQARTRIRYMVTGFTLTAKFALSFTLIPLYGLNGAVAALVLAEVGQAIILAVAYRFAYTRP